MLRRTIFCFLPLLALSPLFAADVPTDVDVALRQRIQTFYQLHVEHKFRQAEDLVAEDSKDFFYESKKSEIREFGIKTIEYAPDFQSAKVTLTSKTQVVMPGVGALLLDLPFYTDWKLENSKWVWHMDRQKLLETPFGAIKPGEPGNPGDLAKPVPVGSVMNAVQADPEQITLDPTNPVPQKVTLTNGLPGPVTLRSYTESTFLKIEFESTTLAANASTVLKVTPLGTGPNRPQAIRLNVQPMNQQIEIMINWAK